MLEMLGIPGVMRDENSFEGRSEARGLVVMMTGTSSRPWGRPSPLASCRDVSPHPCAKGRTGLAFLIGSPDLAVTLVVTSWCRSNGDGAAFRSEIAEAWGPETSDESAGKGRTQTRRHRRVMLVDEGRFPLELWVEILLRFRVPHAPLTVERSGADRDCPSCARPAAWRRGHPRPAMTYPPRCPLAQPRRIKSKS
jgi:hypothetical protein